MRDISIRERTDLTLAILRLRNGEEALARIGKALGTPLPLEPNTTNEIGATRACWTAPGEWLLIGDHALPFDEIDQACDGHLHHLADVTDGRSVIELSGTDARDAIATACSLDLHDRVFPSGRCASTLFAQVAVSILRRENTFTIIADVSYAGHLRAWLAGTRL